MTTPKLSFIEFVEYSKFCTTIINLRDLMGDSKLRAFCLHLGYLIYKINLFSKIPYY